MSGCIARSHSVFAIIRSFGRSTGICCEIAGALSLQYFMQTEEERINDGFDQDKFEVDLLWPYMSDYDLGRFRADDSTFASLHNSAYYEGIDKDRNILRYRIGDEHYELEYGER